MGTLIFKSLLEILRKAIWSTTKSVGKTIGKEELIKELRRMEKEDGVKVPKALKKAISYA